MRIRRRQFLQQAIQETMIMAWLDQRGQTYRVVFQIGGQTSSDRWGRGIIAKLRAGWRPLNAGLDWSNGAN